VALEVEPLSDKVERSRLIYTAIQEDGGRLSPLTNAAPAPLLIMERIAR
jgi:hypothetical protein